MSKSDHPPSFRVSAVGEGENPVAGRDRIASTVRQILLTAIGGESVMFVDDIARQHGLAQSTARKHISSGLYGPPFMLGRRLAVRRADYDAAIRRMAGAE